MSYIHTMLSEIKQTHGNKLKVLEYDPVNMNIWIDIGILNQQEDGSISHKKPNYIIFSNFKILRDFLNSKKIPYIDNGLILYIHKIYFDFDEHTDYLEEIKQIQKIPATKFKGAFNDNIFVRVNISSEIDYYIGECIERKDRVEFYLPMQRDIDNFMKYIISRGIQTDNISSSGHYVAIKTQYFTFNENIDTSELTEIKQIPGGIDIQNADKVIVVFKGPSNDILYVDYKYEMINLGKYLTLLPTDERVQLYLFPIENFEITDQIDYWSNPLVTDVDKQWIADRINKIEIIKEQKICGYTKNKLWFL